MGEDVIKTKEEARNKMTDKNLKRIIYINKKILDSIINIIFTLIVCVVLIVAIQKVFYKDKIPNVLGFEILQVLSGSMSGEFEAGDAILIRKISNEKDLKVGDVVTYRDGKNLITHRIIDVTETEGELQYTLKGDANNTIDKEKITFKDIEGRYIFKITWMGKLVDIINTPIGMTMLVVIPILLIIFFITKDKKKEIKKNMRKEKRLKHELEEAINNEKKTV